MKKSFMYTIILPLLSLFYPMLPISLVQQASHAYRLTAPHLLLHRSYIPRTPRIYRRYRSTITPIDHYPLTKLGFSTDIITQANAHFNTTPGFEKMARAVNSADERGMYGFLKGYLYELELALVLCKGGEHLITAFHNKRKHAHGTQKREIDVMTEHHCIECKNINWQAATKSKKIENQLKKQFTDQKAIVESFGKNNNYLLASREPLPELWKQWLTTNNIKYIERCNIANISPNGPKAAES